MCSTESRTQPVTHYFSLSLLSQGKQSIIDVATQIATLEMQCGINTSVEDFIDELHFGLVEVVYEWACGKVCSEFQKRNFAHLHCACGM